MTVIAATSQRAQPEEIKRINELFELGLGALYLRKPKLSKTEIEEFIRLIPKKYHSKIIIHGHYYLVKKYDLMGMCIRRRHRSAKRKNRLLRFWLRIRHPSKQICCAFRSIHSFKDSSFRGYDFVILNGLIAQSNDRSFQEASTKLVRSILKKTSTPVYALCEPNRENVDKAIDVGFAGAVISSEIFKSSNPSYLDDFIALVAR